MGLMGTHSALFQQRVHGHHVGGTEVLSGHSHGDILVKTQGQAHSYRHAFLVFTSSLFLTTLAHV